MGFLGDLANRVKSDLTYKAGSEISSKVTNKIFNRENKQKTNTCPKCKAPITEPDLKFCPKCGFKLVVTCKNCSMDFPSDTKFCTKCGKAIK